MAKQYTIKRIEWDSANWEIRCITDWKYTNTWLTSSQWGSILDSYAVLQFRQPVNDEVPEENIKGCAIETQFHEVLHHCFPDDFDDGADADETKLNKASRLIKAYLEAHGVDLAPLLKGYK